MIRNLMVAVAVLVSQAALASPIDGTWVFPKFSNDGIDFSLEITITDTAVTVSNTCSVNGVSAVAVASAPAQVTATDLVVLGDAEATAEKDGIVCEASIEKGSVAYKLLNPSSLELTSDGESIVLNKK